MMLIIFIIIVIIELMVVMFKKYCHNKFESILMYFFSPKYPHKDNLISTNLETNFGVLRAIKCWRTNKCKIDGITFD